MQNSEGGGGGRQTEEGVPSSCHASLGKLAHGPTAPRPQRQGPWCTPPLRPSQLLLFLKPLGSSLCLSAPCTPVLSASLQLYALTLLNMPKSYPNRPEATFCNQLLPDPRVRAVSLFPDCRNTPALVWPFARPTLHPGALTLLWRCPSALPGAKAFPSVFICPGV